MRGFVAYEYVGSVMSRRNYFRTLHGAKGAAGRMEECRPGANSGTKNAEGMGLIKCSYQASFFIRPLLRMSTLKNNIWVIFALALKCVILHLSTIY